MLLQNIDGKRSRSIIIEEVEGLIPNNKMIYLWKYLRLNYMSGNIIKDTVQIAQPDTVRITLKKHFLFLDR